MAHVTATQALEEALCLEQEGQRFYGHAAQQTAAAKGREVFLYLASEEANHERLLRRQLDQLQAGHNLEPVGKPPGCDLAASIFPPLRPATLPEGSSADVDALITGLEIETKSYDAYRRRAEEASDVQARETFEFLAAQERLHFDLLMTNYNALTQLGGWSD